MPLFEVTFNQRKRKKTKPLKKLGTLSLAKLFFLFKKKKMQPEADDANRKAVFGPVLEANGHLVRFSLSALHRQGDLQAGQPAR